MTTEQALQSLLERVAKLEAEVAALKAKQQLPIQESGRMGA